jgi:Dyp-type peroxidase family
MTTYPASEVQGLLLSGYRDWHHATYLFFSLRKAPEAARVHAWLGALIPRVTFGTERRGDAKLNVAITVSWLQKRDLGKEALETFSPAFVEGMHSARRSRILGDGEPNHPAAWIWGGSGEETRVDLVLMLFHRTERGHAQQVQDEKDAAASAGLDLVHELPLQTLPASRAEMHEPFGFADGLSQPFFDGLKGAEDQSPEAYRLHHVPVGEFILGYKNGYGEETTVPRLVSSDVDELFGRNGSYLVLRQLEQDVVGFWNYFRQEAGSQDLQAAERLAAKAVGRWRNGSPISDYPDAPGPARGGPHENDFSFRAKDALGDRCPIGAHIRRANPRDSFEGDRNEILADVNHHRLLRRGRAYGPRIEDMTSFLESGRDDAPRGLVFACLNGNIERQFEFVQHSWCDNAKFHGLHDEIDPVIGAQSAGGGTHSIQGWPVRRRLAGIPRFVKTRGGAYFFLPARIGLVQLASL